MYLQCSHVTHKLKQQMLAIFSRNRLVVCGFVTLVLLSVALTFLTVSSGYDLKAIYKAKNGSNTDTYLGKFAHFSSRNFMQKPPPRKQSVKRVNVIILSLPRSGSSFLGEVFNHHPRVLYFFEPLHSIQRKFNQHSLFQFYFSLTSYRRVVSKFLKDVMVCDFSDGQWFTMSMNENDRHRSRALMSSPFCIEKRNSLACDKINSSDLETVCKNNYNVTVLKILTPRIPAGQWDNQLLPRSSQRNLCELRIIHLVRDPRAVVNSLMSLNFFTRPWEKKRSRVWHIERICRQMESDATAGMLTAKSLGARYKAIRFEDLAGQPLSVVSELFQFVGLEMLDNIKQWLNEATHSVQGLSGAYGTRRNSEIVISKWRLEMKTSTVRTIEEYCAKVMGQFGYKLTGVPVDRQLNLNISLID